MIRLAEHSDVPEIVHYLTQFHPETAYRDVRIDGREAKKALIALMGGRDSRVWVSDGRTSNAIDGVLVGAIQQYWFSRDRFATDLVFVCSNPADAIGMIRRMEDWARSRPRVVEVTLQNSSGLRIERTSRLYEMMGFETIGTAHMKRLK